MTEAAQRIVLASRPIGEPTLRFFIVFVSLVTTTRF